MATRADYRLDLKDKLLGLEDEGYGDFEYTDAELNTYLELAVARLYPALYKRVSVVNQATAAYGASGDYKKFDTNFAERIFLIVDSAELCPIHGWRTLPGTVVNLDLYGLSGTVNFYYHDAYAMPADDVTDVGIAAVWTPVIVLGALIEALESRHDTGVRGDPQPTGVHNEVSLLDRLIARYENAKAALEMSLPVVTL